MSSLAPLLDHLAESEEGLALARDGGEAFCSSALRPFLIAALLARDPQRAAVVVAPDDRAAGELAADLAAWLSPRRVRFYPSRGVTYESHLTPPPHLVGLRIAALDALGAGSAAVLVVSAPALSEKVPDPALRPRSFELAVGDLLDLDECAATLVEMGYERVAQVDDRGQFALRGGLLDLFAATAERAVRVELFDIEIESLRTFSTFTQRSLESVERIEVAPAAELALEFRPALLEGEERPDIAELLPLERFRPLLELVGEEAAMIVTASDEVAPTLREHWADVTTAFHDERAHDLYVAPEEIEAQLEQRARIRLLSLATGSGVEFHAQAVTGTARSLAEAESELERDLRSGYRTVIAWSRRGDGERAAHNLTRLIASWIEDSPPQDRLTFAQAHLREGFVAAGLRLAVVPDQLLFHRRRRQPSRPTVGRRGALRSFTDLSPGDYVVHEDHGIARFAGFDTRTVAGVTRDYLYLEYQGDDRVYAPTDQFAKISRYVGAGGEHPTLSRLGGSRWDTLKARARHAAQELAGELLSLYVERRRREGHAFAADGDWQLEFEQRFPYTETPDQRDAIEAVKADMEEPRPMDRLICGDVGYGKTEVALRAAFKAAADGKQVLVLAPTTILSQQHFGTFRERLADYPFTVDQVSRFRSAAEQREALERFAAGSLDILIGTHRLLSRDVRAKDLGLLVIDEEQRFGVKQKERLRQLRLRVDVIAMSATPIPRSLQMSLAGLRDISVIETAPQGRRPVRTYVGEYDEALVRQALERERVREGQAFYLHNRVETIDEVAARLRGLCPGMRFEVAHGQLEESELESRMMSFLRGEADVLVCTSIIESGIDIPAANTLIVERADHFGLAQLYQIRGRVGRSQERAYAYMLYDASGSLTPEGAQRLAALSDFTELGSGFQIAMRDLELRGAGNLLGDEQSGHVAALGFELYMQMLDEALAAAEASEGDGAGAVEWEPVRLDVDIDAYVPAEYVGYEQAKIDLHRRIAGAREVADIELLREELQDRFGEPPEPVENLLALARARIKLGAAGARAVAVRGGRLSVSPVELDLAAVRELRERLPGAIYESGRSQVVVRVAEEPHARFADIRAAADAILAVSGLQG
ncbi:MAG TPA: transcription-repair coupling factor [Solirubrobacteraceae bacterium]